MAQYRKLVIKATVTAEMHRVDESVRHPVRRAKRRLSRESSLLDAH